jgi:Carboxypeptidase regulatory-like domain
LLFAVLLFALSLIMPRHAGAQAISGDLTGTVTDKTGAAVPNASVEATNDATGVKNEAKTNGQGDFRFSNLPVGAYTVRVSAPSFATTTFTKIEIALNRIEDLKVTLEIGSQSTTVEVSGASPLINTTTAQIEGTFSTEQTADLPVSSIGLGVVNLALLQPGVATGGGVGAGTGPSVGGQRPRDNNFTIEGVDNNNKGVTGPLVRPPNDAVEEFSTLQNQFSPEFGHSNGGQFNTVIKSGTNDFHGLAYEYFNNRNLNAEDQDVIQALGTGAPNPRYDFNRFGGQIGGPVFKNKLFFFGNFEYNTLGQASVAAGGLCSPTAAGYTTIAGISGLSATNLGILQKYAAPAPVAGGCTNARSKDPSGAPNPNGSIFITNSADPRGFTPVETGILNVQAPNFINYKFLTTSMDWDPSSNDHVRGRYLYNSIVGIDNAAALPAFFLGQPQKFHLFTLAYFHTFSATLANEFRVGYNRFSNILPAGNFQFPGLDVFPNVTFQDLGLNIGPDNNAPQSAVQNLYQAIDNVTYNRGQHTFKLGIEGRKFITPQTFIQRSRGDYIYSTLDLYLRDITPDNVAQRSTGNLPYFGDQAGIFWYANDDWKIRHNLTINLGVRYEYMTIPFSERMQTLNSAASVPGLLVFSEPQAPTRDFMPRIGFAYSPGNSGNTSIRAGFGLGYDVLYDNIGLLAVPPQIGGTNDVSGAGTPNFLANGGLPPGSGGLQTFPTIAAQRAATANFVTVNQKDPYAEQWNLSVQHKFGSKYSVELGYLGTRGVHLDMQIRINKIAVVNAANALPTFFTAPSQATLDGLTTTLTDLKSMSNIRPDFLAAGFTNPAFVQDSPVGFSSYHGFTASVIRQFSRGLSFTGNYTFSHAIDNSTADFNTTVLAPRRPADFQNVAFDKSNSILDHRHRIVLTAIYDLPYFKTGNWARRNLLGNWLFAPIYTYQSGQWATAQSGTDSNLNGDSATDRVILNPAGLPGTGSDIVPQCNSLVPAGEKCGVPDKNNPAYHPNDFIVAYLAIGNGRYVKAGQGAFANVGRNTLQLPPINNIDFTASKKFNLTERFRLEFQAQFVNILNHPQYVGGFLDRVDEVRFPAGASPGPTTFVTASAGGFNQPSLAFSSNPRNLQLVLKFGF